MNLSPNPFNNNTLLVSVKSCDVINIADWFKTNSKGNLNPGNNVTTLAVAVECNHNYILKMLFEKGVDINL
jgi:hypothetical protein